MPKRSWRISLSPWQIGSAALAALLTMGGAVVAFTQLEPYLPAHRGYVVVLVGDQAKGISPIIQQLQEQQLEGQRVLRESQEERAWGEQLALKRDLKRATDQEIRDLLEERIERLAQEIARSAKARERIEKAIDKLKKAP